MPESSTSSAISGALGGVAGVLVSHPLDSLRIHRQLLQPQTNRVTLARLYRGLLPPLLGVIPVSSVAFVTFDACRHRILHASHGANSSLLAADFCAGALAALPASCLVVPGERLKILQQTAVTTTAHHGQSVWREVLRPSFYRGHTLITLARDVPAYAIWFSTYFQIRRWQNDGDDGGIWSYLLAGSAAGFAQWTVTLPLDALKTRIQSTPLGERLPTIRQCWESIGGSDLNNGNRYSYSSKLRTLYRGYWLAIGRAVPANAISWLTIEITRRWLIT